MRTVALAFILIGALFILMGGLLWLAWRFGIPLGRLPGDLRWEGKHWSIAFPVATCLILSIVITILLNLLFRR